MAEPQAQTQSSSSHTAGCHCGYISLSLTLEPALAEYNVVHCNCSICTRLGYMLVCTYTLYISSQLLCYSSSECTYYSSIPAPTAPMPCYYTRAQLTPADPTYDQVTWHNDSKARCSSYQVPPPTTARQPYSA